MANPLFPLEIFRRHTGMNDAISLAEETGRRVLE